MESEIEDILSITGSNDKLEYLLFTTGVYSDHYAIGMRIPNTGTFLTSDNIGRRFSHIGRMHEYNLLADLVEYMTLSVSMHPHNRLLGIIALEPSAWVHIFCN